MRNETDIQRVRRQLARAFSATRSSLRWLQTVAPAITVYPDKAQLLDRAVKEALFGSKEGCFCEFGVYSGQSINYLASLIAPRVIHGFDSFQGLPEDWRPHFPKGRFALPSQPLVRENVTLHVGEFSSTIPEFANHLAGCLAFLHIDSDLYSSASTILTELKQYISHGTVMVFDELIAYDGWQE